MTALAQAGQAMLGDRLAIIGLGLAVLACIGAPAFDRSSPFRPESRRGVAWWVLLGLGVVGVLLMVVAGLFLPLSNGWTQ